MKKELQIIPCTYIHEDVSKRNRKGNRNVSRRRQGQKSSLVEDFICVLFMSAVFVGMFLALFLIG